MDSTSVTIPEDYLTAIGTPLYPSSHARFLATDTSKVKVPAYAGLSFWKVVYQVGFKMFMGNIDDFHRRCGLPLVDREEMEAAWYKLLLERFQLWDDGEMIRKFGARDALTKKQNALRDAMAQVPDSLYYFLDKFKLI